MCTHARIPSALAPERERVVEVLRRLRVDRDRRTGRAGRSGPRAVAAGSSYGSSGSARPARRAAPRARSRSAPRGPSTALDPRAAAAGADEREVARPDASPTALRVEHDRHARREVRLADDELAARADLDDEAAPACPRRSTGCGAMRARPTRHTQVVDLNALSPLRPPEARAEGRRPAAGATRGPLRRAGSGGRSGRSRAAPRTRPIPSRISAVRRTRARGRRSRRERVAEDRGQRDLLADHEQDHREERASDPQSRPSTMNGPRTNQFVAPTSFITSISRRREKIESRIVFAISSDEATRRMITAIRKIASTSGRSEDPVRGRLAVVDLPTPAQRPDESCARAPAGPRPSSGSRRSTSGNGLQAERRECRSFLRSASARCPWRRTSAVLHATRVAR